MKIRLIVCLVSLLLLSGCSLSNDKSKPNSTSDTNIKTEESSTDQTNTSNENESPNDQSTTKEVVVIDDNISYYDLDGIRHYSLYGSKFNISVKKDLPEPLVLNDISVIKENDMQYLTITIDYAPKGCNSDTCSMLFIGWNIYPDDYDDKIVQANKVYNSSQQNGYFAESIESIDSVLDQENLNTYTSLKEQVINGDLELVWWE